MKTVAGEGKMSEIWGGPAERGRSSGGFRVWGLGFWGSGQRFLGTKTETEQKENEE